MLRGFSKIENIHSHVTEFFSQQLDTANAAVMSEDTVVRAVDDTAVAVDDVDDTAVAVDDVDDTAAAAVAYLQTNTHTTSVFGMSRP